VPTLDHIGLVVSNFVASRVFYVTALAPLGIHVVAEGENWAMLGRSGKGGFWFGATGSAASPVHIAFTARSRRQVQKFYEAALAAGGLDNGPPGVRADYHPNYYAAYVRDLDGHNIEAVCHAPDA
jgi:catechol 2,3-dioxygenase-like lactoylglutathione lyase family enzyme